MTIPSRDILHELSPEILKTLRVIFWENVYATKAIQITLKLHPEWEDNKRALFSETVYDLIRWWRPLWYILDRDPVTRRKRPPETHHDLPLFQERRSLCTAKEKRTGCKPGDTKNCYHKEHREFFENQSLIGLINKENKNLAHDGMLLLHH